jgi:RND family efflux transporter MFP subunit
MKVYKNLFVAAVAISLTAACSGDKTGTEKQERIIPVKVMKVSASASGGSLSYVGTVEESVAVALSFSGMGTVEQVLASEGQRVRKGQLLASLNTTTAQNAYDAAQSQLAQAQDAYDRLSKVHENGSLPEVKFVEIETGLQQAKSMVAISRKSLDDCRLYAPRDGVIASRSIETGESVMPGVAAFKLVGVDNVKVKISVSESEIGSISAGQEATITVPALDNAVFSGNVETKGVAANALSHTYEVKIGIANPQKTLLPGMVCKVETRHATSPQSEIVVPNRAIMISADNRHYVWIAENDVAKRKFIDIGDLTNDGIVVSEGLSAGDKVIVEGMSKVSEDTRILIEN